MDIRLREVSDEFTGVIRSVLRFPGELVGEVGGTHGGGGGWFDLVEFFVASVFLFEKVLTMRGRLEGKESLCTGIYRQVGERK